jgi:antitoxin CptB
MSVANGTDLKRMRMRSWRRGTKEMDLILGPFAEREIVSLPKELLAAYDALLSENDQDLYLWVSGACTAPAAFSPIVGKIRQFHAVENEREVP